MHKYLFTKHTKAMKKLTYLAVAAIALGVASCNTNKPGYVITGTVEGAADGDTVFIQERVNRQFNKLDTAIIANGTFTFEGAQDYLDFTVFEEEIHIDSVAVFRISDVAVHYGILCAFECKCSVSDDSCVQFVELSVHTFLDKYSISVGSAFHSTCYYITGFVGVTRCHHPSSTEKFNTPFINAFSPDVPDASSGRVGVFNQISTPVTRRRANCIS